MRISTAFALAAMSVLLVTGCKRAKKTSGSSKPRTRVRHPKSTSTPSVSFAFVPQNKDERTKTAKGVCDSIALERKERIGKLLHALINGTPQEKVQAANTLNSLTDVMAVPFLMTRLKDEGNRDVRLAAVTALGHIADPASASVLVALLDDEDLGMATAALNALSEMDEEERKRKGEPPYAFVEGTTIKIRKTVQAAWEKKLKEGYFEKKKK